MADLIISPSDVVPGAGAKYKRRGNSNYVAGENIDAGELCFLDVDDVVMLAQATADSEVFLAVNSAALGQPVDLLEIGQVTLGTILTKGTFYYLSAANPGKIAPHADLVGGNWVVQIGYGYDGSTLQLNRVQTGVTV